MEKSYSYFFEKASVLIHNLLIGQGTSKQRLIENEVQLFIALSLDVPEDLKKLQEKILKPLTKKPAIKIDDKISMTSFRHTLINMRNSTASKIIDDSYSLYQQTKEYLNE